MAGRGIEFSGERDFEESSKLKDAEVEASESLELLGEASGTRIDSIAMRTSERKRMRRADEESVCPAEKKNKGVVKLRSNEVGKPGTPSRDSGEPLVGEAFSAVRAASSAKRLLDQVRILLLPVIFVDCRFVRACDGSFRFNVLVSYLQFTFEFDRLVALGVRGNLQAELSRLRADVSEAQKQKAEAEKRIASLARKNRDALGKVASLEKRVEALTTEKEALNALVASYQILGLNLLQRRSS